MTSPPTILHAAADHVSASFPLDTPLRNLQLRVTSDVASTSLNRAAALLRDEKLVSFPTETVYGLGANALSSDACQKIFKAKGRPSDNPLIVHVSSLDMLYSLVPSSHVNAVHLALVESFWPGPLTLVLPLDPSSADEKSILQVSPLVRGREDNYTLAVRMPNHPIALALIHLANLPLAAPSANKSGRPSTTRAEHVLADYSDQSDTEGVAHVSAVLDGGPCGVGVESTVIDLYPVNNVNGQWDVRVLRSGGVGIEDLQACLKSKGLLGTNEGVRAVTVFGKGKGEGNGKEVDSMKQHPTTPGMKYRHYAPDKSHVVVFETNPNPSTFSFDDFLHKLLSNRMSTQTQTEKLKIAFLLLSSSSLVPILDKFDGSSRMVHIQTFTFDSASDLSRSLYDSLRTLDGHVAIIFVEAISEDGVGLAVMERVLKAAGGTEVLQV